MKENRKYFWYAGYGVCALIIALILFGGFSQPVDGALGILFALVFSYTHVQVLHRKMLCTDPEYKVQVMDERNIAIKEKAGNLVNMINMQLTGVMAVIFILMDQWLPAVIVGIFLLIQPILLILVSRKLEQSM